MSGTAAISSLSQATRPSIAGWKQVHSYCSLTVAVLLCLLPFSGRAFHIDDPLFVWAGQQIAKHPLDPYGFQVTWDNYAEPMSEITKNPPLACYYIAAIGTVAGWSERALHLGFLIPALAMVLGTYRLALRFTRLPMLAAAATLLTPGVMVSATSVMCDTMMLALWIWAAILWIEGLDGNKISYLTGSAVLLGLAALTKYFALALLPLLLVYSIFRKKKPGVWALFLLIPVALLGTYQLGTAMKYGHAMFSQAFQFSRAERGVNGTPSLFADALVAFSFTGGCTLSALLLAPFTWRWKVMAASLATAGICTAIFAHGWIRLGHYDVLLRTAFGNAPFATGIQLALLVAAGFLVIILSCVELQNWRDSNSIFLGLWVLGTFIFAGFVNWSVNARSVLPLIPAVGMLLARRIEAKLEVSPGLKKRLALSLALSGAISLWVTKADSDWANSARTAAQAIHQQTQSLHIPVWFEGHWGFQYYMQQYGARPMDFVKSSTSAGDLLVVPQSNALAYTMPSAQYVASAEVLQLKLQQPVFTMHWRRGAGFYSSFYGFLPFVFAAPSPEQYYVLQLAKPWDARLTERTKN